MRSLHYTFDGKKHLLPPHEFRVNTHSHLEYAYGERPQVADKWARTVCLLCDRLGDQDIAALMRMGVLNVNEIRQMTCIPRRAMRPASALHRPYSLEEDQAILSMTRREAARSIRRSLNSVKARRQLLRKKGLL